MIYIVEVIKEDLEPKIVIEYCKINDINNIRKFSVLICLTDVIKSSLMASN